MLNKLVARDFRPSGKVLQTDLATLLREHPEAFDVLIHPVLGGQDESVAVEDDVVGALDSGERAQTYGDPVLGRAMIVPEESLDFNVLSASAANNFYSATVPINILLSHDVRKFSLVQWREMATPDADEPEVRTVYVFDTKSAGHTAGSGVVYVCLPMPAMGEVPESVDPNPNPAPDPGDPGAGNTDPGAGGDDGGGDDGNNGDDDGSGSSGNDGNGGGSGSGGSSAGSAGAGGDGSQGATGGAGTGDDGDDDPVGGF